MDAEGKWEVPCTATMTSFMRDRPTLPLCPHEYQILFPVSGSPTCLTGSSHSFSLSLFMTQEYSVLLLHRARRWDPITSAFVTLLP